MGDSNDVITRVGVFRCIFGEKEWREVIPEKRAVTIRKIADEPAGQTEDRFEKAAGIEAHGFTVSHKGTGCRNHRFERFLPTAQEVLKEKAEKEVTHSFLSSAAKAYGDAMQDCMKTMNSYILCKPQP